MKPRYEVIYTNGSSGFQRTENLNTKEQVVRSIQPLRQEYGADIRVWDYSKDDHIFIKQSTCFKPSLNLL